MRRGWIDRLAPAGGALAAAALAQGWAGIALGAAVALALAALLRPRAAPPPAAAPAPPAPSALAMLRQVPRPLLVIGADDRVLLANEAAHALLARPLEGLHVATAFRAPSFIAAVDETLAGGNGDVFEFRIRRPGPVLLAATVAPLALPEGGRGAVVALEEAGGRASVDATRSDFVANASHELRTPIAAIASLVETARGAAADDAAARERFLGMAADQCARMARLVEDLLSLSRAELQENVAPTERQDLRAVLADAAGALRGMAAERGATLEGPPPGPPVPVLASRDELGQVFTALIENALRHGGEGVRVTLGIEARDGQALASVADDGPGIERRHLPRLTERFYRAEPKGGGTGLGLAIAKHILLRHRGSLRIDSEPGKGARFTAVLPAAPESDAISAR